jgi:pimeloyl-ACP methyl ester carboxylesterase
MDDRGHGKTRTKKNPSKLHNWDIFAEDLERFFEHLGEPVIALGHSRGAVVSMLVGVRRPELIQALILIDPTILPFSWMWWWFLSKKAGLARFVPIAARAARRKKVWPDAETIFNAYRKKSPFRVWQDGFLEGYIESGTEISVNGELRLCCEPSWEAQCFAACPHDVWRYVPQIKQPTLVLYGAKSDTFLAPAVKRFRSEVPAAVFRRFERTSHFVPMERPGETAEAIVDFLKDQELV